MTPDRLTRLYKQKLGEERGNYFKKLWNDFCHLRRLFDSLKDGFGGDDPPMISVWVVSPQFRDHYWKLLVEGIVLSACRLLEKPDTDGKKNVTIRTIPEWFDEDKPKEDINNLVNTVAGNHTVAALREWRDKELAHTAAGEETQNPRRRRPIGNEVEAVLDKIYAVLARTIHGDRDLAPGRRHRNRTRSRTTGNEQWAAAGTSQPRVAGWLSAEWT